MHKLSMIIFCFLLAAPSLAKLSREQQNLIRQDRQQRFQDVLESLNQNEISDAVALMTDTYDILWAEPKFNSRHLRLLRRAKDLLDWNNLKAAKKRSLRGFVGRRVPSPPKKSPFVCDVM